MIPGDLLSAFPHRQFHTLPGLLDSWAALPNSYPNACMPMQGGSLYHFYDGLENGSQGSRFQSIDKILCDYPSFHFGSDLMHRTTKIAQIETLPVCIEQCVRTGSKPARRVFLAPRRVAGSVHATYGSTVSEFFTPRIFDAERQHL